MEQSHPLDEPTYSWIEHVTGPWPVTNFDTDANGHARTMMNSAWPQTPNFPEFVNMRERKRPFCLELVAPGSQRRQMMPIVTRL
jgi:hypothetical protein